MVEPGLEGAPWTIHNIVDYRTVQARRKRGSTASRVCRILRGSYESFFFRSDTTILETQELGIQLLLIETAVNSRAEGWRMFTTKISRLGQGLRSVQKEDIVCVLDGEELPYIIRQASAGLHQFIGSCYVHGLMEGEAYNGDPAVSIELHFS